VFLGQTSSLCEVCRELVPAKIIEQDGAIYFSKRCLTHGVRKALVSTDPAYYRLSRDYLKPGDRPLRHQTATELGCPWDCGLCPDHEQHSCLALLEINEACNLSCPVCFADSSQARTTHRSLDEIARMLDALCESEGEPDVVQISGGEPTIHPQILDVLRMAKARPIRHLMLNTNGVRIAQDPSFVAALSELRPGFEVYLQFDSLRPAALHALRGADLSRIRLQALEALERHGISTTLVVVVKRGLNDDELADTINFALRYRCVRGVTFQPIQDAGRNDGFEVGRDRIVLSEVRARVVAGGTAFGPDDLIPLPCNPESIAVGYALRNGDKLAPLTGLFPKHELVAAAPNAITFEKHPELRRRLFDLLSLSTAEDTAQARLQALLCCLPAVATPASVGYADLFRVAIVEFMDVHNFCVSRVKRSCIHFVTAQGRIVPFETHNLFHRDGSIDAIRARLRGRRSLAMLAVGPKGAAS